MIAEAIFVCSIAWLDLNRLSGIQMQIAALQAERASLMFDAGEIWDKADPDDADPVNKQKLKDIQNRIQEVRGKVIKAHEEFFYIYEETKETCK